MVVIMNMPREATAWCLSLLSATSPKVSPNEKSLVGACLVNEIKGLTEKHTMLSASGKRNLLSLIISRTTQ